MRERYIRRTALALCAAFVIFIGLSIGLSFVHAGHHCADGRCAFCITYQSVQYLVRILGFAAFLRAAAFFWGFAVVGRTAPRRSARVTPSPVSLNIRMNN